MNIQNKNDLEEFLVKNQHEAEAVKKALLEADKKEQQMKESPPLSLEEVTEQMAKGMVYCEKGPIRFGLVQFFQKRLSMPIPIDYLKRHTTGEDVAVLVNEAMGISLTLQYTKSEKKDITFEEVKQSMLLQFQGAGIYIEVLEEGEVEDENAPTYFMTYRMPLSEGVMYHMVFYAIQKSDSAMVIGDYNCFYKDLDPWENIIKATVSFLDFK